MHRSGGRKKPEKDVQRGAGGGREAGQSVGVTEIGEREAKGASGRDERPVEREERRVAGKAKAQGMKDEQVES